MPGTAHFVLFLFGRSRPCRVPTGRARGPPEQVGTPCEVLIVCMLVSVSCYLAGEAMMLLSQDPMTLVSAFRVPLGQCLVGQCSMVLTFARKEWTRVPVLPPYGSQSCAFIPVAPSFLHGMLIQLLT
uniref:Uncharacterized protein n=1 Tax=Ixodes ricinus TaxID=34613 RepID=A0A6B0UQE8_IXORI